MAPLKRKGNTAESAAAPQPQKRVRVGEERKSDQKKNKTNTAGKPKSSSNTGSKASELTVLRDDEPSFPRGGASVLTPLERKQIHAQATKDVLFEQKGSKGPSDEFADDDEGGDVEMEDANETAAAQKPRKKKAKGKKHAGKEAPEQRQGVRIEGLNFKVKPVTSRHRNAY